MGITTIKIYQKGKQNAQKNLIYLSYAFLDYIILLLTLTTTNQIFYRTLITYIGYLLTLEYVDKSFYNHRKSPAKYLKIVIVFLMLITFIIDRDILFEEKYTPDLAAIIILNISNMIVFGWNTYSVWEAYKILKVREEIQPWILVRMKILIVVGSLMVLNALRYFLEGGYFLRDKDDSIQLLFMLLSTLLVLITIIANFLAWVMPEKFKNWIYKHKNIPIQKENPPQISEEEVMQLLKKEKEKEKEKEN